jgi:hypothetical protein
MLKYGSIATAFFLLTISCPADDTNTAPANPATPQPKFLAPTNDVGISSDGMAKDQDSYQVRVGELHAPGGEAYLLPIRVPNLTAGQHFASVHLRTQLTGINNEGNALGDADLYGLGLRDTAKALPGDYYQGTHDTKATLIMAKFLTTASKIRTDPNTGPFAETSPEADAVLTKYFNDLCAAGGTAGKFIFLRISYDLDPIPNGNNAYNILTTGADGDNEPPIITYTLTSPSP